MWIQEKEWRWKDKKLDEALTRILESEVMTE